MYWGRLAVTQAQAREELTRLARGLNHDISKLSADEAASWMRVLMSMIYERGRAAVTRLIDTWEYARFPRPGSFTKLAESMTFEGQANAGAYSQNGQPPPVDRDRMTRVIAQHDRWDAMTQEEYAEELAAMYARGFDPMRSGSGNARQ